MTTHAPLPENYDPIIGTRLIYLPTGEEFKVLCSCPSSQPINHTRRYIAQNRTLYALPVIDDAPQQTAKGQ